jgi:hypothetical protein
VYRKADFQTLVADWKISAVDEKPEGSIKTNIQNAYLGYALDPKFDLLPEWLWP